MKKSYNSISLWSLFIFLFLYVPCQGQIDLFEDTAALKLTIVSDWETVLDDRGEELSLHKARFNYLQDGEAISMRVRIRARGHFRRNPAVCTFPPLKVKIKEEAREGTMFATHKSLKLVCHCKEEEAVLQEYLVYKVYQLLTPYSFEVRLAEITYLDLMGKREPEKHYGFLIEDDKHVARRNLGERFEAPISRLDSLDQEHLHMVYAFMYMIGNTDWNALDRKNIKLITPRKDALPIPVPYDFDWSQAVDASYVMLPEDYDRRKLQFLCLNKEEWKALAEKFLAIEENVIELYKNFGRLSRNETASTLAYYKEFFRMLDKEKRMEKSLIAPCGKKG